MPYIIDGHNLIGRIPDISLSDIDDEVMLIKMLESHFKHIRKKAIVYFDHANPAAKGQIFNTAFLQVIFVRQPKTADTAIIEKLKSLRGNALNYTVVSSDNWIITNASKVGATVISSDDFYKNIRLLHQKDKDAGDQTEKNIDYWLKVFSSDS
jgi:predicted RNA-binding protein with PIN domain